MIQFLENYIERVRQYWQNRKYWQATLTVTATVTALAVAVWLGIKLFYFIYWNFEALIYLVMIYIFLFFLVREHFKEKRLAREQAQLEAQQAKAEIDKRALDTNYKVVRSVLFTAQKNTASVLGLKPVISENDMDSPNHTLPFGEVYLYQYILYRSASVLDINSIKDILQDEVNRLLSNGHVAGLGNKVFYLYEGNARNYIDIYQIVESPAYITVSIAIASDEYYSLKQAQLNNKLLLSTNSTNHFVDKDF